MCSKWSKGAWFLGHVSGKSSTPFAIGMMEYYGWLSGHTRTPFYPQKFLQLHPGRWTAGSPTAITHEKSTENDLNQTSSMILCKMLIFRAGDIVT